MADDFLLLDRAKAEFSRTASLDKPFIEMRISVHGPNVDLSDIYFWHIHFGHTNGKGWNFLKFEDNHYFSESSQFGGNVRQIKGNAIKAFQENFQQLITLIRQHLIPLLKEVKEVHFYKKWFDKITYNDALVQNELKKENPNSEDLKKWRNERNEAVNHLKDKWVNEVDGGKIWQMHKPQTEQGLDFALLPQLFFGINLDDPFQTKKTLKQQLDEDIYPVDVSHLASEHTARFMYRFYTWLPTAIKDTEMTFRLKISALKNIYSQTQMFITFMKPLLMEINRKMEGTSSGDWFYGFEENHPDLLNLMDASFSNIKVVSPKLFFKPRGKNEMADIEFTRYGLFVNGFEIIAGKHKKKSGFLAGEESGTHPKYVFFESKKKDIIPKEFKEIKRKWEENPTYVFKADMRKLPIIEYNFSQRRRSERVTTQQGEQFIPNTRNDINYMGVTWNIYELASYREKLKVDNLRIMESFIEELAIIRDDLLLYMNYFDEEFPEPDETDLFSVIKPNIGGGEKKEKRSKNIKKSSKPDVPEKYSKEAKKRDRDNIIAQLEAFDDLTKVYDIFKKVHKFPHY